jgi:hypothetical protein
LRDRLELLAFDARLAGCPPTLVEALWEAIDSLPGDLQRHADCGLAVGLALGVFLARLVA